MFRSLILSVLFSVDLLELRTMEAVIMTGSIRHAKLQSDRHHQQTNAQFFKGHIPFLLPDEQCRSTEGFLKLGW